MKFIKKIYNDSKELTDKYIILTVISILLTLLTKSSFESRITDLLTVGLPMAYFIYIKTNNGKRNFYILNKVVSVILMLLCAYNIFTFVSVIVPNIFEGRIKSLVSILSVISFVLSILFYLYWIAVFFLNPEQRKKIFKDKFNSNKICKTLIIAEIVVVVLHLITVVVVYDVTLVNIIRIIFNNLLNLLLSIMQVRYVALYQEFKERKEK